ncbi:hypothetical protein WA158_008182 [Blastocystis sp. Blastoise]
MLALKSSFQFIPKTFVRSFAAHSTDKHIMTVRDALNMALDEEMARDPKVLILGEEVGKYRGAYKVTQDLISKYGANRVIDTPITEYGFTGIGVGASQKGLRPIVEFMTWNFAMQACDHIINSAAKTYYMSGGKINCPIVFRGPNGPAAAVSAQHSQCYASWYAHVPGLKVLAPYSSEDAKGLLKAAIRDDNPVVFLEHELLYGESFSMSDEALKEDFIIPIGKSKIEKEGGDVSLISFSKGVEISLKAAEELEKEGIHAEVINLRSLRPLDTESIVKSIKKTHHLITVEEGWPYAGIGSEICAQIMETEAFDYMDAPVQRICGVDVPMPYAQNLETAALPQPINVINAVHKSLYRNKN